MEVLLTISTKIKLKSDELSSNATALTMFPASWWSHYIPLYPLDSFSMCWRCDIERLLAQCRSLRLLNLVQGFCAEEVDLLMGHQCIP
jgi:hypothetical protein